MIEYTIVQFKKNNIVVKLLISLSECFQVLDTDNQFGW